MLKTVNKQLIDCLCGCGAGWFKGVVLNFSESDLPCRLVQKRSCKLSEKVLADSLGRVHGGKMTGVGLLALALLAAGPWFAPGASGVEIDPLSKDCIACHDGASATGIGVERGRNDVTKSNFLKTINKMVMV